jgi:peptide/nickel transport system substrate-binding protein
MRWNFVANTNTRVLSLKSGEAQMVDGVPFGQIDTLQSDSNLALQAVDLPQSMLLVTNTKVEELSDVHVRRAMSLAINREQLNETVFRGLGTVPNSVLMNFELDASDEEVPPFEFDVAKAKEELAKSKFADGFSITMQYPAGLDYIKSMALFIQQDLDAIGIKVELEELEAATATDKWSSGEFETIFPFTGTSSDIPVPDEYAVLFADPEPTNGFGSGWTSPEILALVKDFIGNTDASTRAQDWKTIQEKFIDELPLLNVLDFPLVNAHQIDVCATKANGLGVDQLQETWIAP